MIYVIIINMAFQLCKTKAKTYKVSHEKKWGTIHRVGH